MRCIAIAAVSLDGKIALDSGHLSDWTSKEDKDFLHEMLDKADVIVVGNNTYKTAIEPLSKRNCIVFTASVAELERKSEKLLYANPATANIPALLEHYKTVAILGGMKTYSYFLRHNLLDELSLTIEPIVFGRGLNLFDMATNMNAQFKLESTKKLNEKGSLLLHYAKV